MTLDSGASVHFTPFESDFISITQGNYGRVETANSKASLFMVAVGTVLIEYEIIDIKTEQPELLSLNYGQYTVSLA